MQRLHQIVDRLPADADDIPDVLFDFDEYFTVRDGTNISPPDMRYATSSTFLNDGENVDASAFNNRSLNLELGAMKGDAEFQAEGLQTLGRLLADPRGQWFLWQDEGTVDPRFFHTHPSSMAINDLIVRKDPKRIVTCPIPAEPFAYGYPETGTATIANDPTAATNPMSLTLPPIKGDVPTPLNLRGTLFGAVQGFLVASAAGPDTPTTPKISQNPSTTSVLTGWTRTAGVSDAAAIGGTADKWSKTSGVQTSHATYTPSLPRGDWRVFVRLRVVAAASAVATIAARAGGASSSSDTAVPTYQWYDFGVFRIPMSQLAGDPPPLNTLVAPAAVVLDLSVAGGTGLADIYIDTIMYVPAGLDTAVSNRILMATGNSSGVPIQIDASHGQVYRGNAVAYQPQLANGGLPEVVPGTTNVLTWMLRIDDIAPDDKTTTVIVDWLYYPQYLYMRSATG